MLMFSRDIWAERLDRLHPTVAEVEGKHKRININIVMNAQGMGS
jgi:hypothetical protein